MAQHVDQPQIKLQVYRGMDAASISLDKSSHEIARLLPFTAGGQAELTIQQP